MIEALYDVSPAWPVIIAGLIAAAVPNHHVRKGLALIAPVLAGFSPMMQFIHIDDMADAIVLAYKNRHVACTTWRRRTGWPISTP